MKFFSYDGLLAQVIRYLWKLFLLNICFVLCCLPVITIGSGIAAVYSVFLTESEHSGVIGRFFRAFRENWKQATVIWIIFLTAAILLALNWYFILSYSFPGRAFLTVAALILSALYLAVVSYVFPLQARYDNPVTVTVKNAVALGLSRTFSGLLMGFVTLFPIVLFFVDLEVFLRVIAVWIPLGCALQMQINSLIAKRVFCKIQPEETE